MTHKRHADLLSRCFDNCTATLTRKDFIAHMMSIVITAQVKYAHHFIHLCRDHCSQIALLYVQGRAQS